MSHQKTIDIVTNVLETVKKKGASEAEVVYSEGQGLSVSVRNNDVDTIENSKDKSLILSVYKGKAKGSASTAILDPESIATTIEKALNIASLTEADEYAGLPEKELYATEFKDLQTYCPREISTQNLIELAKQAEASTLETQGVVVDEASISKGEAQSIYATSNGFLGTKSSTNNSFSVVAIAEHEGQMERDYWWDAQRDFHKLIDPKELGKKAAERTIAHIGAQKLKSTKAPVLFDATIAQGLVEHMLSAISGSSLYQESSFLKDDLNQQILPEWFQIEENPFLLGGFASRNYDSNGLATQQRNLIENGVLKGFMLSVYSARRLKMQPTGNAGGAHNLDIQSNTDYELKAALKTMDRGLYVTSVMGQGVNTVNGDYSRGAGGFWVENGEIQFPVNELTIASNLKEMYKNIAFVANDRDLRSKIRTGSWLIEEMTIAGN